MKKLIISEKYQIIANDIRSILIGALIMAGGQSAEMIVSYLTKQDFGTWSPVVAVLCGVVINAVRKAVTKSSYVK